MAVSEKWDVAALRAGVGSTVLFAAPFLIAARLVGTNKDNSGLALILILLSIVGFVIGAGVAAWVQQRRTPLSHGIVTSTGTFVVVQGVFVIIALARGSDVRWFNIFFTLTVTLFAGALGGLLGMNLTKRGLEPRGR